jgi:hypothetical protein
MTDAERTELADTLAALGRKWADSEPWIGGILIATAGAVRGHREGSLGKVVSGWVNDTRRADSFRDN